MLYYTHTHTDTDTDRQTDKQTDRDRDRDRNRDRDRDRVRHTHRVSIAGVKNSRGSHAIFRTKVSTIPLRVGRRSAASVFDAQVYLLY